ncbi:hypothetical protein [Lentilactobacillus kosonis]|uniref:Uncharacterized protein n=1 Tax=Lentilactobacillus kosonis TaxID=2810561 RepID=A0A401FPK4_9LACO|nr:hypothetical protein [Lentilactobacillus kosonis]GAY74294.1 hypothetical protein NBRC111893_2440 [Lentilactobacillus kosonis]
MIAFGLDDTGDLDFNSNTGVFNMIDTDQELAQKLWIALGINVAELPWNEDIGLNQLDLIMSGDDQTAIQTLLDDYLQTQWADTYDNIDVTEFKVDNLNRLTELSATVTLKDGSVAMASVEQRTGDDNNANDE